MLLPEDHKAAELIGVGNVSRGVRKLCELALAEIRHGETTALLLVRNQVQQAIDELEIVSKLKTPSGATWVTDFANGVKAAAAADTTVLAGVNGASITGPGGSLAIEEGRLHCFTDEGPGFCRSMALPDLIKFSAELSSALYGLCSGPQSVTLSCDLRLNRHARGYIELSVGQYSFLSTPVACWQFSAEVGALLASSLSKAAGSREELEALFERSGDAVPSSGDKP